MAASAETLREAVRRCLRAVRAEACLSQNTTRAPRPARRPDSASKLGALHALRASSREGSAEAAPAYGVRAACRRFPNARTRPVAAERIFTVFRLCAASA